MTRDQPGGSIYPQVDWEALARPTWKDRVGLPPPVYLPVYGCSMDPTFYQPSPPSTLYQPPVPPAFERMNDKGRQAPFGERLGYRTNMGLVGMPMCVIKGHVF